MSDYQLVVPIRIEARFLESETQVSPPLADFSKLPWNNGQADVNFDQPFISEGIVHEPFEGGFMLNSGLHMHFILPHFLGKQYPFPAPGGGETVNRMPAAPNRWLVTKSINGAKVAQWLVQGDYVHAAAESGAHNKAIIPFKVSSTTNPAEANTPPFRYIGKSISNFDATGSDPAFSNSFKQLNSNRQALTVTGYGDINFSAFYPNCFSVFGFNDPDITADQTDSKIDYQVIGWLAEGEDDFLREQVVQLLSKIAEENSSATDSEKVKAMNSALKKRCGVKVQGLSNASLSKTMPTLFYAKLSVKIANGKVQQSKPLPGLELAVGNTGTEALSALLADKLSGEDPGLSKAQIENQLEYILLRSKIDPALSDAMTAKFAEARHEKGFRSSHSGHLWKIKETGEKGFSHNTEVPTQPSLPPEIASLLYALNNAQKAYDSARHEVELLRNQLYQDWVKYMKARYPGIEGMGQYPDADHIQYFLQNYSCVELREKEEATGRVIFTPNERGHPIPTTQSPVEAVAANDLVKAWRALHDFLKNTNEKRAYNEQPSLYLSLVAGPGFWEAKAPTVLLSGLNAENVPAPILKVQAIPAASGFELPVANKYVPDLSSLLTDLEAASYSFQLHEQEANPYMLDWSVNLHDSKLRGDNGAFSTEAVKDNFDFDDTGQNLSKNPNTYQSGVYSVFSGSVLMSSHAKDGMLKHLTQFFKETFKKEGITFTGTNKLGNFLPFAIPATWTNFKNDQASPAAGNWTDATNVLVFKDSSKAEKKFKENFIAQASSYHTAWKACQVLSQGNVITQTLDGFNEASIMKKKVAQLPIDEPIGFDYAKHFTDSVSRLVQTENTCAPVMAFEFNPIRSGAFSLNRLDLIDNFGMRSTVDLNSPILSESLLDQDREGFLHPRFSQPARLNLRWHSAEPVSGQPSVETNDSPETSPVCGWLMANNLNEELAVYDAGGKALGYLSGTPASWNLPPWGSGVCDPDLNIQNVHLRKVVKHLISISGTDTKFLDDFIAATDKAMDNIAPANAGTYDIKSILMGKPMAVVRARVSYELKGKAAISQSWSSLLIDLTNSSKKATWGYDQRNNDSWTAVRLPCKLGEYEQLNDGLIGYWVEQESGKLGTHLYVPETKTDPNGDPDIVTDGSSFPTQWLALDDSPLNLTLLMDPRATLHATTGFLPTKCISIPTEHYLPAMQKLEMWFRTFPLLQDASPNNDTVSVDLPPVSNYEWQWWDPYQGKKKVSKSDRITHDHTSSKMIEGWLTLSKKL